MALIRRKSALAPLIRRWCAPAMWAAKGRKDRLPPDSIHTQSERCAPRVKRFDSANEDDRRCSPRENAGAIQAIASDAVLRQIRLLLRRKKSFPLFRSAPDPLPARRGVLLRAKLSRF